MPQYVLRLAQEVQKFGGMDVADAKRLKHLEDENRRQKQMVADLSLDKQALEFFLSKKL